MRWPRKGRRKGSSRAPLLLAAGASLWAARRLRSQLGYTLRGKTVLVTGGSRGLGLAVARQVSAEGARVVICSRDEDSLERAYTSLAKSDGEVLALTVDVTNPSSVREMIDAVRQHYGTVDVLINNAGVIEVGPAATMSVAAYEEAMATNFWGMLYPTLELLPEMRARRSGRIVNITSIGGKLGIPHLLPYSASKFAAVGFSQGLRAEVAGDGIKVVTVCPGLMRTESPRNAIFRGRHRSDYAWFSISDALPGLSISAEEAARRIVAACRRGDAEVLFPLPARLAAVVNAVAPGFTAGVLATVDRMLSSAELSRSGHSRPGDPDARKFNQIAPAEGATP